MKATAAMITRLEAIIFVLMVVTSVYLPLYSTVSIIVYFFLFIKFILSMAQYILLKLKTYKTHIKNNEWTYTQICGFDYDISKMCLK